MLIEALRPLVDGGTVSVPGAGPVPPKRRSGNAWRWGGLAALLVAAVAAGGGYSAVEREHARTAATKEDAERRRREAAQKIKADKRAEQLRAAQNGECLSGWVWREAWAGNKVCVTPPIRSRVASENANAANPRQPGGGAYGAATCRQGDVWREARQGDVVCVAPASRDQARADNAAAALRRVQMP